MSSPGGVYLDGNAAAGRLSTIFGVDLTVAEGQCARCGTIDRFARSHTYMMSPGVVARCAVCDHILLRLVRTDQHVLFDAQGLRFLIVDASQFQESGE